MNMDRQREVEHLALAERHVAEGQLRVTAQQVRLNALRVSNSDGDLAEKLLETLEGTLAQWIVHCEAIRRRIEAIDLSDRLPHSSS